MSLQKITKLVFLVILLAGSGRGSVLGQGTAAMPAGSLIPDVLTVANVVRDDSAARQDRAPVLSAIAMDDSWTFVATGGDDHLVRVWDGQSLSLLWRLVGHTDWVSGVAFVPRSQGLVTVGHDGRVILWDLAGLQPNDPAPGPKAEHRAHEALRAVAIAPDGRMVAVGGFSGVVSILELPALRMVTTLRSGGGDVRAVAFSPDGRLVAAGTREGSIRVWGTEKWTSLTDLRGHDQRVRALAFSPSGRRLLSGGEDRKVILWDPRSSRSVVTLEQPAAVCALAWWNEDLAVVGGTDNVVRCLRISDGAEVARLAGHTGTVTGVVCQPEVGHILSVGYDTTIRVWTTQLREKIAGFPAASQAH